ncbi:hypothetical protein IFM89_030423 [Coptis chinensis]|uniref:NAB domain-containing protein n=1 Tax=Coptis chinensis TaxID=261450 RepID=A0A835HXI9_9MAGN|nr:hypothetical protein IFM89_030423 [Coptis chinensis]
MYYKKRVELMKRVEEFYRAYRALARKIRSLDTEHSIGPIKPWRKRFPTKFLLYYLDDSPSSMANRD